MLASWRGIKKYHGNISKEQLALAFKSYSDYRLVVSKLKLKGIKYSSVRNPRIMI